MILKRLTNLVVSNDKSGFEISSVLNVTLNKLYRILELINLKIC